MSRNYIVREYPANYTAPAHYTVYVDGVKRGTANWLGVAARMLGCTEAELEHSENAHVERWERREPEVTVIRVLRYTGPRSCIETTLEASGVPLIGTRKVGKLRIDSNVDEVGRAFVLEQAPCMDVPDLIAGLGTESEEKKNE